jgi:hypothetical protein
MLPADSILMEMHHIYFVMLLEPLLNPELNERVPSNVCNSMSQKHTEQ